jgi:hypothetical protein
MDKLPGSDEPEWDASSQQILVAEEVNVELQTVKQWQLWIRRSYFVANRVFHKCWDDSNICGIKQQSHRGGSGGTFSADSLDRGECQITRLSTFF